eukprot:COSAG01_NODE_1228_length_11129_cov_184.387851_8_plen_327_part_00
MRGCLCGGPHPAFLASCILAASLAPALRLLRVLKTALPSKLPNYPTTPTQHTNMLRAATKRPATATARLLHSTAAARLSSGGAGAAASTARAASRSESSYGNVGPDKAAHVIEGTSFSYGAMVAQAAERGQHLSRSERQSVLLAQAAAEAKTPPRPQHLVKSSNRAGAAQLPSHSASPQPLQSLSGARTAAAAAVGSYSVGRDVVSALGQRTRAQRLSQVQRFLETSRHSSSQQSNNADAAIGARELSLELGQPGLHGGGVVASNQVGFSARHKPGHSWSMLAGRPAFSYGHFVAEQQQTQHADAPDLRRVSARKVALRKFLDATA